MHGSLPNGDEPSNKSTDTGTDKFDSEGWFAALCRELFGPGSGTTMAILTGVGERYCWRYASEVRPTKPSATFLCLLLRSERGEAILNYVMDGSNVAWWREHRLLARKAALAEQALTILSVIKS